MIRQTGGMTKKIASAVDQQIVADRERRARLAREAAKLDPADEKAIAEEGLDSLAPLDRGLASIAAGSKPLEKHVRESLL